MENAEIKYKSYVKLSEISYKTHMTKGKVYGFIKKIDNFIIIIDDEGCFNEIEDYKIIECTEDGAPIEEKKEEVKFKVGDKLVQEYIGGGGISYFILSALFFNRDGKISTNFTNCRHATQEEIEKYFSN